LEVHPLNPWRRGAYRNSRGKRRSKIPAGNNIGKPFEVDLFEGSSDNSPPRSVKLSFQYP
jgi:hypothetical protein